MAHKVYKSIVDAVRSGRLKEPFTKEDIKEKCPGLGKGTYNAFLHKHRVDNPGGSSELFELVGPGSFKCTRPFKYGL